MAPRTLRLYILRSLRMLSRPEVVARILGLLVLFVGLVLTWLLVETVSKRERQEREIVFRHAAEQATEALVARFSLYVSVVEAGRALHASSTVVSRDAWHRFAHFFIESEKFPGLDHLPVVRFIRAENLETELARIRADGAPGFTIDPPGEREFYCPIVYYESPQGGAGVIGFDTCTREPVMEAMMASMMSGRVTLTGRLELLEVGSGEELVGVVMYGPIHTGGNGSGSDSIEGWIGIPLIMSDAMRGLIPPDSDIGLTVHDGVVVESSTMLYSSPDTVVTGPVDLMMVQVDIAGRPWSLVYTQPASTGTVPVIMGVGGAAISLLLCILLWRLGTMRARAQSLAETMTVAYRESEEKYRTIIESLEDAYFESDLKGDLTYFNSALSRTLGYPMRELFGMNNRGYMDEVNARKVFAAFNRVFRTGESERGLQWEVTRKDGGTRHVEASISIIRDAEEIPCGFRGIARDITERRRADARIHYLAHYDVLTGLPNRTLFEDRVRQTLKRRWRGAESAALLFIDLDRFKTVNDSLGHHVGDLLLQVVAARIKENVREGDTVCRPGGDEFLVLLNELNEASDAATVAQNILTAVAVPYTVEGWEFSITPSMGIAIIPVDGSDLESLSRHADVAMYHAKESGRNNYQFFNEEMTAGASERLAIEHGLRRALERDEFRLMFQPLVDVRSGQVIGAEALLRWERPGHGLLNAADFIDIAEQSGLILGIGNWVLAQACHVASVWQQRFNRRIPVAVNLSAFQFRQHGIPATIAGVLTQSGLDPGALELELTETVLMQEARVTIETVRRLRDLGVHFSIDDFGTGYSSLSYLKRFPIDRLKIDKSFIRDLTRDPEDAAIVDAIINMAGSLRMEVIAEGVETQAQAVYLRDHGCYLMQGHWFSAAVPVDQFVELVERGGFRI